MSTSQRLVLSWLDRIRLTGPSANFFVESIVYLDSCLRSVARVNLIKQVKTDTGWKNFALDRDGKGRIKWTAPRGRYLIEWYDNGKRRREAAGITPAEALEAQRRKRLELEARKSGLKLLGVPEEEGKLLLTETVASFLKDIKAFRKPLTFIRRSPIVTHWLMARRAWTSTLSWRRQSASMLSRSIATAAFFGTDLDIILREWGVDTVIVSGTTTRIAAMPRRGMRCFATTGSSFCRTRQPPMTTRTEDLARCQPKHSERQI